MISMPTFTLMTHIAASPERCFDLSRDVDAHTASMPDSGERAVAGVTTGMMELHDEVTWEARHLGLPWRMTSRIVAFERPRTFADQMVRGPFGRWHHVHRFEPTDGGTMMIDEVDYRSPVGPIGRIVDAVFMERYMRRLMETRNTHLKLLAESGSTERAG